MNNLAFTLIENQFQFKTLVCKQHVNRFQWSNNETRGSIHCGTFLPHYSYSTIDFKAIDSLALNYHPKDADGFLFMINSLSNADYVQLMTEKNLVVDYAPRKSEVYVINAQRLFSFTFAPQTIGNCVIFFVRKSALKNIISPALIKMIESKSHLPLSEMLNEKLYEDLCVQTTGFFKNEENINSGVISYLLSLLRNFNEVADKTNIVKPMNAYHNVISAPALYDLHREIA